jgi:hypothetical protein
MKSLLLGFAVLSVATLGAASAVAEDLEILDPQISQAFAQFLTEVADKIEKPQVKVEGDIEKACGCHREQVGLIIVPQKGLKPEEISDAVNSDPGAPVGHLFMSMGFAPMVDDKPLDAAKMRTLPFTGQDGTEQKVRYLTLAARHTDDDVWHLYGYGTEEKPVLDVQIGEGTGPGTQPLAIEVKDIENNTGTCYVTIFDLYQTSFKLNYKEPEGGDKAAEEKKEEKK